MLHDNWHLDICSQFLHLPPTFWTNFMKPNYEQDRRYLYFGPNEEIDLLGIKEAPVTTDNEGS